MFARRIVVWAGRQWSVIADQWFVISGQMSFEKISAKARSDMVPRANHQDPSLRSG
jgi:hypothetical protein